MISGTVASLAVALLTATPGPRLVGPASMPQVGQVAEWSIVGLPVPERPFDDRGWRLVATIERPRRAPAKVEGFWYAPFRSVKGADGKPAFAAEGSAGWRLRFTPMDGGAHRITLRVTEAGRPVTALQSEFRALPGRLNGFVRPSKVNPEYLATADGKRFLAIGKNTAWWNDGGLADYERWAARMEASGMNYARLWMAPWSFGIEQAPGQLGNYALDRAWALDQVLETFRRRGIHVVLCIDYHGMLQETKDYWGSNDNWRMNPYNAALGGPAKDQNAFFTDPEARRLYRQRLRYIVARYAAFPNVAVWEFWNEIDNVRQHFREVDMIAWHREMARVVRGMDPYGRLVSTSLIHDVFPTLWTEAGLDLTQSHSYNQANPGLDFAERAARFRTTYRKPYIVGEYGVDFRAPNVESDPKRRGLKQAIWGSLIGGGAGIAQSWWWETLDAQNAYPTYKSIADFARATPIGGRGWRPLRVRTMEESATLPPADPSGRRFSARIPLLQAWGDRNRGFALLADAAGAGAQSVHLNGFLHGLSKPELRRPFVLRGHFPQGARVAFRVNSVSDLADLRMLVDGKQVWAKSFADKDGKYDVNDEFGEIVTLSVPAGARAVEVRNVGRDWAFLDWVEVSGVRVARPMRSTGTAVRGVASGTAREATVWVVDPAFSYPANAKVAQAREVRDGWVDLPGIAKGRYEVRWWDTLAGRWTGRTTVAAGSHGLRLRVPPFREDIAAWVRPVGPRAARPN